MIARKLDSPEKGCSLCFSTPPTVKSRPVDAYRDIYLTECDLCGNYRHTWKLFYDIKRLSEDDKFFLSCWIRTSNIQDCKNIVLLSDQSNHLLGGYTLEQILRLPFPRTAAARIEQALVNLSYLARKRSGVTRRIAVADGREGV